MKLIAKKPGISPAFGDQPRKLREVGAIFPWPDDKPIPKWAERADVEINPKVKISPKKKAVDTFSEHHEPETRMAEVLKQLEGK